MLIRFRNILSPTLALLQLVRNFNIIAVKTIPLPYRYPMFVVVSTLQLFLDMVQPPL